jgi:hypothetical protein
MKFEIIVDTENGKIDILYDGYNIIAETIYNEELTETIKELIQNELYEDLESLIEYN